MWSTNPIGNTSNPLLTIDLTNEQSKSYSGRATAYTIIKPLKGLSFETKYSANLYFNNYREIQEPYYYSASQRSDNLNMIKSFGSGRGDTWYNILSYNTTLLQSFNVGLMDRSEIGKSDNARLRSGVTDLLNNTEEMYYF